jgi:hypothetical protein
LDFVLGFPPSETLWENSHEEIERIMNVFTLKETCTMTSFHSQQSCSEETHANLGVDVSDITPTGTIKQLVAPSLYSSFFPGYLYIRPFRWCSC